MSVTCSGQTKAGGNCTKKVKSPELYCHFHRPVENDILIKAIPLPKNIVIDSPKINNSLTNSIDIQQIIINNLDVLPTLSTDVEQIKQCNNANKLSLKVVKEIDEKNILNIWTWNVNSVRNKIALVDALLIKHNIDILLLTETKIQVKHENDIKFHEDYTCIWNSNKKTYHHGVAFVYKKSLNIELLNNVLPVYGKDLNVKTKITKNTNVIDEFKPHIDGEIEKAYNTEGRILVIKYNNIVIVGTYVPNAGCDRKQPLKRLGFRTLGWDVDQYKYLLDLENKYENVVWIGDLNVTILDNDVLNTKCNLAGVTTEERENIKNFLNEYKWIDTWHQCNPKLQKCRDRATWLGDNLNTTFPLRLDYVLCSPSLKSNILSAKHDQSYYGSDHIPTGCKLLLT